MILIPTTSETFTLPNGCEVSVPKCTAQFVPWNGPAVPTTYGGKSVLDFEGQPYFAELVALRMVERDGWKGVWVDSYGRRFRTEMPKLAAPAVLPKRQLDFLNAIRKKSGFVRGCWDVFAWRGNQHKFIELKRKGKDQIRETQVEFLNAALDSGLSPETFLICEWDVRD